MNRLTLDGRRSKTNSNSSKTHARLPGRSALALSSLHRYAARVRRVVLLRLSAGGLRGGGELRVGSGCGIGTCLDSGNVTVDERLVDVGKGVGTACDGDDSCEEDSRTHLV